MKRLLFLGFALMVSQFVLAQKRDRFLETKINHILEGFHGKVGVYVHDLRKNRFAAIQADTIFPTASMVKIPILTGIMKKISTGELHYHQELIYKDSLLYPGVDILGSLQSGSKIELSKVMLLMLSLSDNTASLWLQSLAGTGTRINELMDSLGLRATRVNSRTPGRENNRSQYGWGHYWRKL
jgi:beta-lactamase class A